MNKEASIADKIALDSFLKSPNGIAVIREIKSRRPPIKDDPSVAHGWELCIQELVDMAAERGDHNDLGGDKLMTISVDDDRDPSKRPNDPNEPHTGRRI